MRATKKTKIAAVIPVYNEEDIIYWTIKYLTDQGIHVHILDNESTDSTPDIIKKFSRKKVAFSSFSTGGEFNEKLQGDAIKKAFTRLKDDYEWFIRNDADEFLESPFANLNLADAINLANKQGFNAIGAKQFYFCPMSSERPHSPGKDIRKFYNYFQSWEKNKYYDKEFHPQAHRIWKINTFKPRAGVFYENPHKIVPFEKIKIFPNLFIIRHYLYRNPEATYKKIFKDRKDRLSNWNIANRVSCRYLKYSENDDFLFDYLRRELAMKKKFLKKENEIKSLLPAVIKKSLPVNFKNSLRSCIKGTINFGIRLINVSFNKNPIPFNLPPNLNKWSEYTKPKFEKLSNIQIK